MRNHSSIFFSLSLNFLGLISVLLLSRTIYFAMASYHLETDELEQNHRLVRDKVVVHVGLRFESENKNWEED